MEQESGRSRTEILGVGVDQVTLAAAVARCLGFLSSGRPHLVVTPNAEIVYAATGDAELRRILNGADLAVPDGAGVVLAARILGNPVPEKVAGVDLAHALLTQAPAGTRVYLLGARPESVAAAARRLPELYPGIHVCGYRDGYWAHWDPAVNRAVVAAVRAVTPHILLAGLGSPLQEKWLALHLEELGVPLAVGIGGGIDMWAGVTPRAPRWLVRLNLEWVYRIVRFGRYGRSLPPLLRFAALVLLRRLALYRGPRAAGAGE